MTSPLFKALNALEFDDHATLGEITLPSVALSWSDEMLLLNTLFTFPAAERKLYHQAFAIRVDFWLDRELNEDSQSIWEMLRREAPRWPVFQRLDVDDAIKEKQLELESRVLRALQK